METIGFDYSSELAILFNILMETLFNFKSIKHQNGTETLVLKTQHWWSGIKDGRSFHQLI
jgi:hypothetical protein